MKRCPQCKREVLASYDFCEKCGAKAVSLPSCNYCFADLDEDQKFCGVCGKDRVTALTTEPTLLEMIPGGCLVFLLVVIVVVGIAVVLLKESF